MTLQPHPCHLNTYAWTIVSTFEPAPFSLVHPWIIRCVMHHPCPIAPSVSASPLMSSGIGTLDMPSCFHATQSQNHYICSAYDWARLGTCQFWHHRWHLCWRRVVVHDTPTCLTSSYTCGLLHYETLFAGLFGVKLSCTLFTHFFTSYHFIGKGSLEQRWHPSGV